MHEKKMPVRSPGKPLWQHKHLLAIVEYIAAQKPNEPLDLRPCNLCYAQKQVLPKAEWLSDNAFYNQSFKPGGRNHNMIQEAIKLISLKKDYATPPAPPPQVAPPLPAPEPSPSMFTLQFNEDRFRAIVREELQSLLAGFVDQLRPGGKTVAPVVPVMAVPQRRIDVIGLMSVQAQEVSSQFVGRFALRFINSDDLYGHGKVRSFAPTVVLCTKFINHSIQEAAKSAGATIHYANGAAGSVVEVLKQLEAH